MTIDAISGASAASGLADVFGAAAAVPARGVLPELQGGLAVGAAGGPAQGTAQGSTQDEEEAEAARLLARREEQMSFLRTYIETYGAPEEKERIQEEEPEGDEDEKKRLLRAAKRSQVIEDPEEPGAMKVVVWQKGRDGTYHVSRVHEFDDGRGTDADETRERRATGDDEPRAARVSRTV